VSTVSVPPLSARQKRAQEPLVVAQWSVAALLPSLPLRLPVPSDLPPSPKLRYRSQSPVPARLTLTDLASLSDFEIALALIDFSPLERVLAQHYVPSRKGQVPFHPVSLFLALALRRDLHLSWRATARLLASPNGAHWPALLGFADGQTPSASGLRFFFQAVGAEVFADLCPRLVALLRQHGLFPEHSTYPDDPPTRGVSVCQDGMLHDAHDQSHCSHATATCYQPLADPRVIPLTPVAVPSAAPAVAGAVVGARPCRAREKGWPGCSCATSACQEQCQRASTRDPQARVIHYAGHNHKHPARSAEAATRPAGPAKGRNVFGYRSVAERVLDDRFAVAWTLRSTLYPANTDERGPEGTPFVDRVAALRSRFADLTIGEWIDDAGVGYSSCLDAIWELGALRMVDLRADKTDADPAACLQRGYDGNGRPLCPHGFLLRANGFDQTRRRAKYVCAQACRREPLRKGAPIQPITDCPYLDPARPRGFVVNVGRTLPDGSVRLAREIPYGSPTWKARYGRRNLAENRNSQIEAMGLKRLTAWGLARATKEVQLADFLINLRTLGRLVPGGDDPPLTADRSGCSRQRGALSRPGSLPHSAPG
jgi:hypothetical protein